jgi:hypothetical protein
VEVVVARKGGHSPKALITPITTESPIWTRKEQLAQLRKRAHDAILHSQMMMIKDLIFKAYQIGDLIWLDARNLKTTHPTHKLRTKQYGPFKVTNALSHVAYQLQLPNSWKIHNVFHTSYLSHIGKQQPEWEVETIVGMRLFGRRKQMQYRVHWKGYSSAHNTWEPKDNIQAPKLIKQYHQSQGMCDEIP